MQFDIDHGNKASCVCRFYKLAGHVSGPFFFFFEGAFVAGHCNVYKLMTRCLYTKQGSKHAWYEHLEINPGVQRELEFWRSSSCVAQYNAQPIWLSPSAVRLVYSGASDTGYGG